MRKTSRMFNKATFRQSGFRHECVVRHRLLTCRRKYDNMSYNIFLIVMRILVIWYTIIFRLDRRYNQFRLVRINLLNKLICGNKTRKVTGNSLRLYCICSIGILWNVGLNSRWENDNFGILEKMCVFFSSPFLKWRPTMACSTLGLLSYVKRSNMSCSVWEDPQEFVSLRILRKLRLCLLVLRLLRLCKSEKFILKV